MFFSKSYHQLFALMGLAAAFSNHTINLDANSWKDATTVDSSISHSSWLLQLVEVFLSVANPAHHSKQRQSVFSFCTGVSDACFIYYILLPWTSF